MAKFTVLSTVVTVDGTFEPGNVVELPYETAKEKVEADKLVSYGVLESAAGTAKN